MNWIACHAHALAERPLQQILPLDEPNYDFLWGEAITNISLARECLLREGALPADDWLLIAGWQVWQLPKDRAFLQVRGGELYLSLQALQQLQVRTVVAQDRVVLWNGSYRQAVLLDGKDGFREGKEVWVRLLALIRLVVRRRLRSLRVFQSKGETWPVPLVARCQSRSTV